MRPKSLFVRSVLSLGLASALLVSLPVAADAASHSGVLQIKGVGTVYSGANGVAATVAEPVAFGGTDVFELKVLNRDAVPAQFNVKVSTEGVASKVELFQGSVTTSPAAVGPDGWYTPTIAPGKSLALTLKVTVPKIGPRGTALSAVTLYGTDGAFLSEVNAYTSIQAPAKDAGRTNMYARQGSQPFVGSPVEGQVTSSPALARGASAVFDVKLQNNTPIPLSVPVAILDPLLSCMSYTIKRGTVDITALVGPDGYQSKVLAPGASELLKVTVKRDTTDDGCLPYAAITLSSQPQPEGPQTVVSLLVPYPASN